MAQVVFRREKRGLSRVDRVGVVGKVGLAQFGHKNALEHHAAVLVPVKFVLRQPVLAQSRVKDNREHEALDVC